MTILQRLGTGGSRLLSLIPHPAMGKWSVARFKELRHATLSGAKELAPSRLDVWLALLLAMGVLGFLAIVVGFLQGHEKVFNAELGVPWGILISTYVFFVVSASGMCLISSLGHVFGVGRFHLLGRRAVFLAIITLFAGFVAIGAELERPWRMLIYVGLSPNLSSAIWWMGALYGLELIFLIAELFFLSRVEIAIRSRESSGLAAWFYRVLALGSLDTSEEALRKNMRFARLVGIGGVLAAIAATSILGGVFGLLGAKSSWYGPYMPIYLILSAFVSGAAILALVTLLNYRLTRMEMSSEVKGLLIDLGRLLLLFLGILLFILVVNTIVGLYGNIPGKSEALMLLVSGPLSLPFWGLEVVLGMLVPLFILLNPRTQTVSGVGLASLLVVIGLFAARYDLVIAGQLVPVVGGAETLSYIPSYTEALIVAGVFAFCAFLYTLGERVLPLGESGSRHD
ncbi:MAG: Ni/Fe-hydrogenase 2 integral rane subunit HybB [Dehalococcoidia bacterium]|nr:Ni/Fe-hydrogenase 2 integral rane subunit HybB [Dehalococcoidia bacterium]